MANILNRYVFPLIHIISNKLITNKTYFSTGTSVPHLLQISGSKSSLQVFTDIPSLAIQSQKYLKG